VQTKWRTHEARKSVSSSVKTKLATASGEKPGMMEVEGHPAGGLKPEKLGAVVGAWGVTGGSLGVGSFEFEDHDSGAARAGNVDPFDAVGVGMLGNLWRRVR
jgi:hypothetical protein